MIVGSHIDLFSILLGTVGNISSISHLPSGADSGSTTAVAESNRKPNPRAVTVVAGQNVKMARPNSEPIDTVQQDAESFDGNRKVMEKVVVIGHAVACPTRLSALRALGENGCSLTQVARQLGVAPSTAAHHLSVLVDAGLAVRRPKGRECIYRWSRSRWQLVRERPPAPPAPMAPAEEQAP